MDKFLQHFVTKISDIIQEFPDSRESKYIQEMFDLSDQIDANNIKIFEHALWSEKLKLVPIIKYTSIQTNFQGIEEPICIIYDSFKYSDKDKIIDNRYQNGFFNVIPFKYREDFIRPIFLGRPHDIHNNISCYLTIWLFDQSFKCIGGYTKERDFLKNIEKCKVAMKLSETDTMHDFPFGRNDRDIYLPELSTQTIAHMNISDISIKTYNDIRNAFDDAGAHTRSFLMTELNGEYGDGTILRVPMADLPGSYSRTLYRDDPKSGNSKLKWADHDDYNIIMKGMPTNIIKLINEIDIVLTYPLIFKLLTQIRQIDPSVFVDDVNQITKPKKLTARELMKQHGFKFKNKK